MARLSLARPQRTLQNPRIVEFLFTNRRLAWLWLIVRVYVGYQWFEAGLGKITNPAWMNGGTALKGFWERAVAIPEQGKPLIAFDWYRTFLSTMLEQGHYTWFAKFVAIGELLVGVGLIVGAFVGVAALAGAFMNWNYIMAGSASTNGLLLCLGIGLVVAWKIAGYIGLDYYVLPILDTLWRREAAPAKSPSNIPAAAPPASITTA
jgi:thiosulfate dehydrogenase [quinone] large subunit